MSVSPKGSRSHHPQRVAPAEHVEVDVQRGPLAPRRGDPRTRAQQALFFQVPECDLHPVVRQRPGFQCLRQFQHGRDAGCVVGGAMANVDPVVVRADQQQGRVRRSAQVGDQVGSGLAVLLEVLAFPRDAQCIQALADGGATRGGVAAGAHGGDLGEPAGGHIVGPSRQAGEHRQEQRRAQATPDIGHGGIPSENPSMPQPPRILDPPTRM